MSIAGVPIGIGAASFRWCRAYIESSTRFTTPALRMIRVRWVLDRSGVNSESPGNLAISDVRQAAIGVRRPRAA